MLLAGPQGEYIECVKHSGHEPEGGARGTEGRANEPGDGEECHAYDSSEAADEKSKREPLAQEDGRYDGHPEHLGVGQKRCETRSGEHDASMPNKEIEPKSDP